MTYSEIQDAVIKNSFASSRRAEARTWIQARHAWLWDAEPWIFRKAVQQTVTFTANSNTVNLGSITDLRSVDSLWTALGDEVRAVRDRREFFREFNANASSGTGTPEVFTVVNGVIYIGPKGDGTTGLLDYEKAKPELSDDADETGLPSGYDLALVHGAKAEGFKLSNIPMAEAFDADFNAYLNAMRLDYLSEVNAQGQQFGAYRPGY